MNDSICASLSAYTEISCSDAASVSAVAQPVIEIGAMLVVIIVLAIIGMIMKKSAKKVRLAVNAPLGEMVEKLEQEKLLDQKP
ncbi:hypothetical protein FWH58_01160 [Candidatus Saccharibacteria bacterium]|nr:hypothetical protein [Candidatus Saccharibacteria bacterium]